MSTTFPTTLQDLDGSRGTSGQPLSSPNHITHHTTEDDTIEALQAKVGVDSSAVTTTLDYKLKNTASIDPGHKHTTGSINGITGTLMFKGYAADAGSTDAYAISAPVTATSYAAGDTYIFKANTINTGACTLNVDSLGAKTIKKNYNSDLADGDIKANQLVEVVYDGTNFQMVSPIANSTASFTSGVLTHDISSNTTDTVAHGLGVTPRLVKVTMLYDRSGASICTTVLSYSAGASRGIYAAVASSSSASTGSGGSIVNDVANGVSSTVAIGAPDATNFTITWAKSGGPTGTVQILWEAFN